MSLSTKSVLLVDDQSMFRVLLSSMLTELGFGTIDQAKNGAEALELLKTNTYNLLLADYVMEPIDGVELLKTVRSSNELKGLPFIMISANRDLSFSEEVLKLGANGFIARPIDFNILKQKIAEAFNLTAS